MDQLMNPDTGLMIWVIITFLCLVAILKMFAWGPLLGAIEAREGRIRADREGAEKARAEAERIQKDFEAQIAGVQAKVTITQIISPVSGERSLSMFEAPRSENFRLNFGPRAGRPARGTGRA